MVFTIWGYHDNISLQQISGMWTITTILLSLHAGCCSLTKGTSAYSQENLLKFIHRNIALDIV